MEMISQFKYVYHNLLKFINYFKFKDPENLFEFICNYIRMIICFISLYINSVALRIGFKPRLIKDSFEYYLIS